MNGYATLLVHGSLLLWDINAFKTLLINFIHKNSPSNNDLSSKIFEKKVIKKKYSG